MLKKLTASLAAIPLFVALFAPVIIASSPAIYAQSSKSAACQGIGLAGSGACDTGGQADSKVSGLLATIVRILSVVVGIAAVIMIIVSGFKYVTSAGDANKISSAKSTLVYAIVGLVIVALAQFIVHFVLTKVG